MTRLGEIISMEPRGTGQYAVLRELLPGGVAVDGPSPVERLEAAGDTIHRDPTTGEPYAVTAVETRDALVEKLGEVNALVFEEIEREIENGVFEDDRDGTDGDLP